VTALGGSGNPSPPTPGVSGRGGKGYLILRDTNGDPFIRAGAQVDPGPVHGRNRFEPEPNGESQAVSRWYDGGSGKPAWQFGGSNPSTGAALPGEDLVYEVSPKLGQQVWIEFQAAPDKGGAPDPDPSRWHPFGNNVTRPYASWETDLARVRAAGDFRWLRFRVRFELLRASKYDPPQVNRIVIRSLRIRS
jgi:hypothetical protein